MSVRRKPATLAGIACVAAAAISVSMLLAAPSFAGHGSALASSHNIAFVCATPALAPFYSPMESGAKDAAKAAGVNLTYTGLTSAVTNAAMVQVLQAAINTKPDAIVACNYFPSGEDPLIKAATAKGVPVFFTNTTTNAQADGVTTSFGQPDLAAGLQAGEQMYKAGVRHPLCFDNSPINPATVARCSGFAQAFKSHGIKATTLNVPESQYGNNTAWLSDIQGALASDQKIDGLLGLGQVVAPLMIQAVSHAGRTGKVTIGTFDLDTQVLNEIAGGQVQFAVWQQPYLQGYLPVMAAALYLHAGFKYSDPLIYTGPTFVTKANVAVVKTAAASGLA